ncbi:unnamed protein product [Laminaria digitata]
MICPTHSQVITTCAQGSSCQQLLCGVDGWGWHTLRRKTGLDAETKRQVIDAVLRRHGVGCLLEWVESDIILKEKTVNIQASFLVGVTEAICYDGSLARSGLTPGLHNTRTVKHVSSSSSSSSSSSPSTTRSPVAAGATAEGDNSNNCGDDDGGTGAGGEMGEGDVTALRESAALLARHYMI